MSGAFETIIVAAFGLALVALAGIWIAVALQLPFISERVVSRGLVACLAVIAIGFPVVMSGNERVATLRFFLSGAAALVAIRVGVGPKASWATWAAGLLVAATIVAAELSGNPS
jgi:hypothetical protein